MKSSEKDFHSIIIQRIIALWGFNEAAFGGILHALKIPFTGLFVGSIAAVLIVLIAHYSKNKSVILKATFIVILVKGIISPHTPITAYGAVLIEGFLGYIVYTFIKHEFTAALMTGFICLLYSALQKLLVTTIVFGTTIWKSIDLFADYVFAQIQLTSHHVSISVSLIIILLYTLLHIATGLAAGLKGFKLPAQISSEAVKTLKLEFEAANVENNLFQKEGTKKRLWWKKPTRLFLIMFLFGMMLLTYFYPQFGKNNAYEIMVMLIRAAGIMIIWSLLLSSSIKKVLSKLIEKNKFKYTEEIDRITILFPAFRKVINYCWKNSTSYKGYKRVKKFFADSIILLLVCDL